MAFYLEVVEGMEVAEAFAHLATVDHEVRAVEPVAHEGFFRGGQ